MRTAEAVDTVVAAATEAVVMAVGSTVAVDMAVGSTVAVFMGVASTAAVCRAVSAVAMPEAPVACRAEVSAAECPVAMAEWHEPVD